MGRDVEIGGTRVQSHLSSNPGLAFVPQMFATVNVVAQRTVGKLNGADHPARPAQLQNLVFHCRERTVDVDALSA